MLINIPPYLQKPFEGIFQKVCPDNKPEDISKVLRSFVLENPLPPQRSLNDTRYETRFRHWLEGEKGKNNCPPKDPPTGTTPASQETNLSTATSTEAPSSSYALNRIRHAAAVSGNTAIQAYRASSQSPWYRDLLNSMGHFLGTGSPTLVGSQTATVLGQSSSLVLSR